ncbi:MAG: radical SAM protein [Armatimonadetes bacterium]|nr:radical SAM protein [Armatimonadota bacterium]
MPSGRSRGPIGITLKPTLACNLRCRMCSFVADGSVQSNPRDSLALEVWKGLIDDVAPWRPYVWLTGGEPTLWRGFAELLGHCRKRRLLTGVTTNGTMLAPLAEAIMRFPMDILVISVDGTADVHNRVRGRDRAFERMAEGVAAIQRLRRASRTARPTIVLSCAITPDNYDRLGDLLGVADDLGADALSFQHLWQMTPAMVAEHNRRWGSEHRLPIQAGDAPAPNVDIDRLLHSISVVRRASPRMPVLFQPGMTEREIGLYYAEPERFVKRSRAACAWLNTDVLPNGDVSPCFGMVCGNITQQGFREIWNGPGFTAHRRRLSMEGDFPICARCCAYWRRD